MDELQLRMPVKRVDRIIAALERDLKTDPDGPEADEVRALLTWLRYRVALRTAKASAVPDE